MNSNILEMTTGNSNEKLTIHENVVIQNSETKEKLVTSFNDRSKPGSHSNELQDQEKRDVIYVFDSSDDDQESSVIKGLLVERKLPKKTTKVPTQILKNMLTTPTPPNKLTKKACENEKLVENMTYVNTSKNMDIAPSIYPQVTAANFQGVWPGIKYTEKDQQRYLNIGARYQSENFMTSMYDMEKSTNLLNQERLRANEQRQTLPSYQNLQQLQHGTHLQNKGVGSLIIPKNDYQRPGYQDVTKNIPSDYAAHGIYSQITPGKKSSVQNFELTQPPQFNNVNKIRPHIPNSARLLYCYATHAPSSSSVDKNILIPNVCPIVTQNYNVPTMMPQCETNTLLSFRKNATKSQALQYNERKYLQNDQSFDGNQKLIRAQAQNVHINESHNKSLMQGYNIESDINSTTAAQVFSENIPDQSCEANDSFITSLTPNKTSNKRTLEVPKQDDCIKRRFLPQNKPNTKQNAVALKNESFNTSGEEISRELATVFERFKISFSRTYDLVNKFNTTFDRLPDSVPTMEELIKNINTRSSNMTECQEIRKQGQMSGNVKEVTKTDNAVDNTPHNLNTMNKITLPPEYNATDSKWTLKYRKLAPGLVELLPESGIYVNAIQLENCKQKAYDCKSLARMLVTEVFSLNALRVCSLTGDRARAFKGDVRRPGLDLQARMVILTFVEKYGSENGFSKFDYYTIVNSMRNKIKEIRAKYRKNC